jgi:subfamily B ATP-binding cassette protein MsbA
MTQPAPTLDYQGKKPHRRSNRDFWRATRFLWPYRKTVAISVLCAFLTGAFTAAGLATLIPILRVLIRNQTIAQYVGEITAEPSKSALKQLGYDFLTRVAALVPIDPIYAIATVFGFVFILGLFGSITRFFQEYLSESTAITAINDIREKLYDHILRLPLGYFTRQQNGIGDLTGRLVTDAMGLQEGFKTILGKAVQEPITAGFALAVAMWIDWRLTIFIIIFTPVMILVIRKLGTKVRRAMRAALEKNSSMLGQIGSTLNGIRVVKSTNAEPFERDRYRGIMMQLQHDQFRMAKYDAWSTPLLEMLGLLAVGSVLIFASYLVFRDKTLDPEQLITLMICLVAIAEPLRRISKLNTVLQKGNAAAARIFEILREPIEPSTITTTSGTGLRHVDENAKPNHVPEAHATTNATINATFNSAISFENLTFSYPGASATALRSVNLEVKKGTSVAIVGRNGSGKTTLLSLLPRFFEPDSGAIKIDGVDIKEWPLEKLRSLIGIVTQEAVIFPGTIAQNIAYALPGAKFDDIVAAAKRASAHEFILAKPNGYDATLDGLGGQLSGGQRQRINIARAILRDTPILVLDEATSQVDAESEHLIQNAITELMKDRTTFVIAHRFSTILSADVIIVMEAGEIVGQGKHEELLQTCEIYRQLYERQMVS